MQQSSYFTKHKTIWTAEADNQMAGFLVGTEKRGGSVKLAPDIMRPEYQQKGLGTQLWRKVEEIYRQKGARKIYNHAPLYRFELLKWVTSLGLKVEAHLREHYRGGQDEYVAGKLLKTTVSPDNEPVIWRNEDAHYSVREYQETDKEQLHALILGEMPRCYDEIDPSFVESIVLAAKRFDDTFKKKGKKVFVVELEDGIVGCCVSTPKRGGAVKLVPYIFNPKRANYEMAGDLLSEIETFFRDAGYRKLYAPLPILDLDSSYIFRRHGFEVEGLLREPYKGGIDNLYLLTHGTSSKRPIHPTVIRKKYFPIQKPVCSVSLKLPTLSLILQRSGA